MNAQITRRRFLANGGKTLLAVSVGGGLLAACAQEAGQPATTAAGPVGTTLAGGTTDTAAGSTSFTLWTSNFDASLTEWSQEFLWDGFEEAFPGYDLDVVLKPFDSFEQLLQTALSAGEGPDVVGTLGPAAVGQYVDQGWLLPLDDYAEQYGWDEKMLGWALDSGRVGGQLYAIPSIYESFLILYNKEVFDQYGWSVPTNRAELEAIATDAMGQGIVPFSAGNGEFQNATEWYITNFFNHYAGPDALYQALTTEIPFTEPVFVDAIADLNDWFQKGWLGGGVERYFTNGFNDVYSALAEGTAAMDMDGDWAVPQLPEFFGDQNDNWDWFPIPPLRDGVPYPLYELGIGGTISINADSDSADAVAQFIDWQYSSPELAAQRMADLSYNPWPIPIPEEDFPSSVDPRFVDYFLDRDAATNEGNFGYAGYTFFSGDGYLYLYEEMEKVMTGALTPAEFCQGLDELHKQAYAEGRVPPIIERA